MTRHTGVTRSLRARLAYEARRLADSLAQVAFSIQRGSGDNEIARRAADDAWGHAVLAARLYHRWEREREAP